MKISLKNQKNVLSRSQMRTVVGGAARGGACNKCCWEGTTNCSACNGGNSCSQGVLTACGSGDCDVATIQQAFA